MKGCLLGDVKMSYPISNDLIVACKIHELYERGEKADFGVLVGSLLKIMSKTTVVNSLNKLADWGIIRTDFGETSRGRSGRLYSISGESRNVIRETYDRFWPIILEIAESK